MGPYGISYTFLQLVKRMSHLRQWNLSAQSGLNPGISYIFRMQKVLRCSNEANHPKKQRRVCLFHHVTAGSSIQRCLLPSANLTEAPNNSLKWISVTSGPWYFGKFSNVIGREVAQNVSWAWPDWPMPIGKWPGRIQKKMAAIALGVRAF